MPRSVDGYHQLLDGPVAVEASADAEDCGTLTDPDGFRQRAIEGDFETRSLRSLRGLFDNDHRRNVKGFRGSLSSL